MVLQMKKETYSSMSEFLKISDLDIIIQTIKNKEKKPIIFTSQPFNLDIR